MLLDDGGVEVASAAPRRGVVMAAAASSAAAGSSSSASSACQDDGGGDDEAGRRRRPAERRRHGPRSADSPLALGCRGWRRPASRSSRRRRGWAGPTAATAGQVLGAGRRRGGRRRRRPGAGLGRKQLTGRQTVRPARRRRSSGPCARSASGARGGRGDVGDDVRAAPLLPATPGADAGRRRRALRVVPALRQAAPAARGPRPLAGGALTSTRRRGSSGSDCGAAAARRPRC